MSCDRSRRRPGTARTRPRSRGHRQVRRRTLVEMFGCDRASLSFIARATIYPRPRSTGTAHTARRRDAALHGPRDPLAHRDERERSDGDLVEAARCGALVVATHADFGPRMEKSVAAFRGSSHGKLYIVNDNEPGNVNSGIVSRVGKRLRL